MGKDNSSSYSSEFWGFLNDDWLGGTPSGISFFMHVSYTVSEACQLTIAEHIRQFRP